MSRGFYDHELESVKREWEQVRWQSWITIQPHVKKGKVNKPTDLVRFNWEKETVDIKELKRQGLELVRRWGKTLDSVN